MEIKELQKIMQDSGVAGAGGAGFPTYAKLTDKADTILMNCAECEPLLKLQRQLLEKHAYEIMKTFNLVAETVGASEAIIGNKRSYGHDVYKRQVEVYAQLLYQSKLRGGPKEFDKETIEKLYEIRRKMGLPGKHPADLCQNKDGINCHNCGGCMVAQSQESGAQEADAELIANITKQVMAQLGMK